MSKNGILFQNRLIYNKTNLILIGGIIINLDILITTIITSTSALVAIIGGFLVSRVITLSSEQSGIRRRLKETINELNNKKERLSKTKEFILSEDALDFIRDNAKEILENQRSLEDILRTDEYIKRSIDEISPFVSEFNEIFTEMMDLIEETSEFPNYFSDFLKVMKGDFSKPDKKEFYEIAYDTLIKYSEGSQQLGPLAFNTIANIPNVAEQRRYNEAVKEKEQLEYEIKFLETQFEEQNKVIIDYGKPKGIWGGMIVLIYSCIVGIAYPVTLLPYPVNIYNDVLTKWFLILLFVSEIVVLFTYLTIEMKKLTKIYIVPKNID